MPTSTPAPPAAAGPRTGPRRRRRVLILRGVGVVLVLLLLATSAAALVVRFLQPSETRTATLSATVIRAGHRSDSDASGPDARLGDVGIRVPRDAAPRHLHLRSEAGALAVRAGLRSQ